MLIDKTESRAYFDNVVLVIFPKLNKSDVRMISNEDMDIINLFAHMMNFDLGKRHKYLSLFHQNDNRYIKSIIFLLLHLL